jgi:hypothetical protein
MDTPASRRVPALEHTRDRAYFTDRDGVRWRLYDVSFGPPHAPRGKWRRYELTSPRATYRRFVSADGVERCYPFRRDESRSLTVEAVARQLASAEYLPRSRLDPSTRRAP